LTTTTTTSTSTTTTTTTTTTPTSTSTSIIDIEERKITRIQPQHFQPNRTATMFTMHSVFIALALLCLIVQSSSTTTATELDENGIVPESLMLLEEENTRLLDGDPKPKAHPPSSDDGGSSGGSNSNSNSGGGNGGSSGSSSSSSSSGSSSSSSSTADANNVASAISTDRVSSKRHRNLAVMLSFAAVAGVAIAALVVPRTRKIETKAGHPLTGSLNRRINLFSNFARHADSASRPPRRDEEGRYINADAIV